MHLGLLDPCFPVLPGDLLMGFNTGDVCVQLTCIWSVCWVTPNWQIPMQGSSFADVTQPAQRQLL